MARLTISLALQGGGAHGAFTWGALDRLLDERDLDVRGISGTSAGAINACILAQDLPAGRKAAQAGLARFWRRISELGSQAFNPYHTTPMHQMARAWNLDWSPASLWLDMVSQFVSPYQLNPLDHNPLRDLIEAQIRFAELQQTGAVKLFVCATNVLTNKMRVFGNRDLSVEALLASACLPQLHRAVQVDDAYYWDGGFIGNPVLNPLIHDCDADDLMLIQLNPMTRASLPISSRDILDRLNEVTMNAALMRELHTIATITKLIEQGVIQDQRYRPIRFHRMSDPGVMSELGLSSKMNTAWSFLTYLRDAGRACADRWLAAHRDRLGKESTLALAEFEL